MGPFTGTRANLMEPQKQLDVSRMNALGWQARIRLKEGLIKTVDDFRNSVNIRGITDKQEDRK